MGDVYQQIDEALDALTGSLSDAQVAQGWTPETQQWWLGYLSGLRDGLLVPTDFEKSSAPRHLARWLDHFGVSGSRTAGLIIDVQSELDAFAPRGEG